tara:strand:- start:2309 stop:2998 length:690 start_codon:yes stop_codon:yes gene_type:complete
MKTLSVIVPFFNEENTLKKSVDKLIKTKVADEIILVDDCSEDSSYSIGQKIEHENANVKLLKTTKNLGKGGAINYSLKKVSSDLIAIHDADLEYNPKDLVTMKKKANENPNSIIVGSRFLGRKKRQIVYKRALFANKILSFLFSIVNKIKISDVATCYKMIPADILLSIDLIENGFSFETEVLSKSIFFSKNIIEVPIEYYGRSYEEGKKIKLLDGIDFAFSIIKYKFK